MAWNEVGSGGERKRIHKSEELEVTSTDHLNQVTAQRQDQEYLYHSQQRTVYLVFKNTSEGESTTFMFVF